MGIPGPKVQGNFHSGRAGATCLIKVPRQDVGGTLTSEFIVWCVCVCVSIQFCSTNAMVPEVLCLEISSQWAGTREGALGTSGVP